METRRRGRTLYGVNDQLATPAYGGRQLMLKDPDITGGLGAATSTGVMHAVPCAVRKFTMTGTVWLPPPELQV